MSERHTEEYIEHLQQQLTEKDKEIASLSENLEICNKEVVKKDAVIEKLRGGLGLYADANRWLCREVFSLEFGLSLKNDSEKVKHIYEGTEYESELGGKHARAVLAETEVKV